MHEFSLLFTYILPAVYDMYCRVGMWRWVTNLGKVEESILAALKYGVYTEIAK
jgi:hypothetical protein